MADISALQVVDTAVKIGLGAAVAGVSAIFVARHNYSHEFRTLRFHRRLDAIEKVSDVADKHFAVLDVFLGALTVAYGHIKQPETSFNDSDRVFLENVDNQFMASVFQLKEAAGRLRLLNEPTVYRAISSYTKLVATFRNDVIVDGATPEKELFDSVVSAVASCKKDIYQALGASYAKAPK